jgi:hypothetical protein
MGETGLRVAASHQYTVPRETIPGFKSSCVIGLYSQQHALRQRDSVE